MTTKIDLSDILGILPTSAVLDEIGETEILRYFGADSLLKEIGVPLALGYACGNSSLDDIVKEVGESNIIDYVVENCDLPALANRVLKRR